MNTQEEFEFGMSHIIRVTYDIETGAIKYVKDVVTDWDGDYYIISEYGYSGDILKEKYVFRSFGENDDTGVERLYKDSIAEPFDTTYFLNGLRMKDKRAIKFDPNVYVVSEFVKDILSMNIKDIRLIAYKKYNPRIKPINSSIGPNLHLPLDEDIPNVYSDGNLDYTKGIYEDVNKQLKKVH